LNVGNVFGGVDDEELENAEGRPLNEKEENNEENEAAGFLANRIRVLARFDAFG
jgi:hypothetical protein